MKKLVVATGNPGKLKEIQEYLTNLAIELHLKPDSLEIDETGTTFVENARLKASQVANALGEWAIADDSGLEVEALDGAPGIYSARYARSDRERIDRLLDELGNNTNRQARFICAIALARPDGAIVASVEGICPGEILYTPCGTGGFGYDPIFYVPQEKQTFAQMKPEVKHKISHRGKAFEKLIPQLRELGIGDW
ncbi:MAG: RdgB/HAM1 family non-canonical purine NTP pyrophosphatase [Hydrococcus sp. RU_2_2]|nr:RdgB/HAM1 family non-canonical purine NTP pyrophosphatase [Hydrococcus sp. RU_2_2]NJP19076.1 RdgB/HAM1 family non-canonical purine NTP pyrophosphatase [Hydrococcus sp. CRU_1_1]NJQ97940.1 RdgB/HAM1 family non-canonical purine NTP pyrophosphatase [Hydrococcus sp. CSU_1_8]